MSKYTPIHVPRGKHFGNNYYNTYSVKLKRNVILYSQLEYHNFLTLEMNPHVIDFCEQPLQISVEKNNKSEKSIPDMWVLYDNGKEEFQEVKYQKELESGNNLGRSVNQIKKQQEWCKIHGYIHTIRTEQDIYISPFYIYNLRYLRGLVKRNQEDIYYLYIKEIESHLKDSKLTILNLTQLMNLPSELLFTVIAYGVYKNKLCIDLETRIISYDTYLWIT